MLPGLEYYVSYKAQTLPRSAPEFVQMEMFSLSLLVVLVVPGTHEVLGSSFSQNETFSSRKIRYSIYRNFQIVRRRLCY